MKEVFDPNYQFEEYCRLVGLPLDKMHPIQRDEISRAFMGGFSQMFNLLRNELTLLEEEQVDTTIYLIEGKILEYWARQKGTLN